MNRRNAARGRTRDAKHFDGARQIRRRAPGPAESFADVDGSEHERVAGQHLDAGSDANLLTAAVEEVIYRLDADGESPAAVEVSSADGGRIDLRLRMVDAAAVEIRTRGLPTDQAPSAACHQPAGQVHLAGWRPASPVRLHHPRPAPSTPSPSPARALLDERTLPGTAITRLKVRAESTAVVGPLSRGVGTGRGPGGR